MTNLNTNRFYVGNLFPKDFESLGGVTSMDVSSNMDFICLGLEKGQVILIHTDLNSNNGSNSNSNSNSNNNYYKNSIEK